MARPKQQVNRRQDLIEAAKILFAKKGFNKTTMEDVAKYAGISKGSLYLEFKNKDEIKLAIIEQNVTKMIEDDKHLVNNASDDYMGVFAKMCKRDPIEIFDMILCEEESYVELFHRSYHTRLKLLHLCDQGTEITSSLLKKAAINNEISPLDDYHYTANILDTAMNGFYPPYDLKYSLEHRNDVTKEELREIFIRDVNYTVDLLIKGLRNN